MAIYYMFWTEKYAPELGVYHSYDIAVYEAPFFRGPTLVLRDVTPEWDLAFRMIEDVQQTEPFPDSPEGRGPRYAGVVFPHSG